MPNLSTFPTAQPPNEFYAGLPSTHDTPTPDSTFGVLSALPPPPESVQLVEQHPHYEWWTTKFFYRDEGVSVTPVFGPIGTPSSVTRSRAPSGYLLVRGGAKRMEIPPTIPSSDLGDPNAVLVNSWVSACVPGHLANGSAAWCMEWAYTYALRVPYREGDTLMIGKCPFTDEVTAENTIATGGFNAGLIGPNQPPAGAPTNPITF